MRQSALMQRPFGLDRSLPILLLPSLLDSPAVLAIYLSNAVLRRYCCGGWADSLVLSELARAGAYNP